MSAPPASYLHLPDQTITGGSLTLRPVQPADIEPIRQWRNAQVDVLRQAAPITADAQKAYFATKIWPDFAQVRPANILLTLFDGTTRIGYGGLVHVAWAHARAEISFLLKPDLARDDTRYGELFVSYLGMIRELAFERLLLHRLFTETYAFRTAQLALLEAAGFHREGTLRHHVIVNGNRIDSIIHACLAA